MSMKAALIEPYSIRRFAPEDAAEVLNIIHRGLREVNAKDYPADKIAEVCGHFSVETLLKQAETAHMYVAASASDRILGTGTIAPYWGSETESILLTIYVLPELIGHSIGAAIIRSLEQDEFFLRANRIEIPAAVTALGFYRKMGYVFKDGKEIQGNDSLVRLEKRRSWSGQQDSNLRPHAPKARALPD